MYADTPEMPSIADVSRPEIKVRRKKHVVYIVVFLLFPRQVQLTTATDRTDAIQTQFKVDVYVYLRRVVATHAAVNCVLH